VAAATQGEVSLVDPAQLGADLARILRSEVIATAVSVQSARKEGGARQ